MTCPSVSLSALSVLVLIACANSAPPPPHSVPANPEERADEEPGEDPPPDEGAEAGDDEREDLDAEVDAGVASADDSDDFGDPMEELDAGYLEPSEEEDAGGWRQADAGGPMDGGMPTVVSPSGDASAPPAMDAGTRSGGTSGRWIWPGVTIPDLPDQQIIVVGDLCFDETCNGEDDDCDGRIDEGGAALCPTANGRGTCTAGECRVSSCENGFLNCDGRTYNGCESDSLRDHSARDHTCRDAESIGSFCGDECSNSPFAIQRGSGSTFFRWKMTECSWDDTNLRHRLHFSYPAGTHYELYVYSDSACSRPTGEPLPGIAGARLREVNVKNSDSWTETDDHWYWVEVRYMSGVACGEWELEFWERTCR